MLGPIFTGEESIRDIYLSVALSYVQELQAGLSKDLDDPDVLRDSGDADLPRGQLLEQVTIPHYDSDFDHAASVEPSLRTCRLA